MAELPEQFDKKAALAAAIEKARKLKAEKEAAKAAALTSSEKAKEEPVPPVPEPEERLKEKQEQKKLETLIEETKEEIKSVYSELVHKLDSASSSSDTKVMEEAIEFTEGQWKLLQGKIESLRRTGEEAYKANLIPEGVYVELFATRDINYDYLRYTLFFDYSAKLSDPVVALQRRIREIQEAATETRRPEPVKPEPEPTPEPAKAESSARKPEPVPPTTLAITELKDNLKAEVDAARQEYLAAKKEFESINMLSKVGDRLGLSKDTHQKIEAIKQRMQSAETVYKDKRAQFVVLGVDNFVYEQTKLLEQRFLDREEKKQGQSKFRQKVGSAAKAAYEGYKGLGKYNLEKLFGDKAQVLDKLSFNVKGHRVELGRMAARAINARTAISFGLLGSGLYFGAGSAVGLASIISRRGLAGLGSGIGTNDLLAMAGYKLDRKIIERELAQDKAGKHTMDWEEVGHNLAKLESQGLLSGKSLVEIKNDQLYQDLYNRFLRERNEWQITKKNYGHSPEHIGKLASQHLDLMDTQIDQRLAARKRSRILQKTISAGVGLMVGSGALAKLFGHKTSLSESKGGAVTETRSGGSNLDATGAEKTTPTEAQGTGSKPITESIPQEAESANSAAEPEQVPAGKSQVLEMQKPKLAAGKYSVEEFEVGDKIKMHDKAWAEVTEDGDLRVHAGVRGFEGALTDLRNTDTEKYQAMVKWLESQKDLVRVGDPARERVNRMIHRLVLRFADENGYTVGDSGPKDLNRILQGGFEVKADGSVNFNLVDEKAFVPEAGAPASTIPENLPEELPAQPGGVQLDEFDPTTIQNEGAVKGALEKLQKAQETLQHKSGVELASSAAAEQAALSIDPELRRAQEILRESQEAAAKAKQMLAEQRARTDYMSRMMRQDMERMRVMRESTMNSAKGSEAIPGSGVVKAAEATGSDKAVPAAEQPKPQESPYGFKTRTDTETLKTKQGWPKAEQPSANPSAKEAVGGVSETTDELYQEALKDSSLAKGLQRLGGEDFKVFLYEVNLAPEQLDKVQDMTLGEFFEQVNQKGAFRELYLGLSRRVNDVLNYYEDLSHESIRKKTVKEFLLAVAKVEAVRK